MYFYYLVNTTNPLLLTYVSRFTNGRTLGNGKTVAWFDNGIAAVLINTYTLDYVWTSSQVFIFDIYETGYIRRQLRCPCFPNSHQLLPSSFSSIFLAAVTSPSSLALLDDAGKILIFSPTQPEYYSFVEETKSIAIYYHTSSVHGRLF